MKNLLLIILFIFIWTIAGFIWGMNLQCYLEIQQVLKVKNVHPINRDTDVSESTGMFSTADEMLTSPPEPPIPGKIYWADGIKWDPCGLNIGISYFIIYKPIDGSWESSDYIVLFDAYGNLYISGVYDEWEEEMIYFERKYVI